MLSSKHAPRWVLCGYLVVYGLIQFLLGYRSGFRPAENDFVGNLNIANGIDFGAIDGKPVQLIILLASPPDQTGPHIQALARISRMLTDDRFRSTIKRSTNAAEVYTLISDSESKDQA